MYIVVELVSAQSQLDNHVPCQESVNKNNFTDFEAHLETVRQALKIPGMSATVIRDQELIWASGFGYADLENQLPIPLWSGFGDQAGCRGLDQAVG